MHVAKVGRLEEDTDLLLGFPNSGVDGRLAGVELSGRQVSHAVECGADGTALAEQDAAVIDEEYVHVDQAAVGRAHW